jgi:hypothetical protein
MAAVRVVILMQGSLLKRADSVARRMGVPRSKLLSLALEDFLARRDVAELTRRTNEACQAPRDEDDQAFFRFAASSVAKWAKHGKR